MDKLKMQSPNLVDDNIDKIAKIFPNCITETRDEKDNIRRVVDFDLLRQELSHNLVEGHQERYTLNWPGKSAAILAANAPIAKTFRPCEEESVDFDTTQNLFIEGDNLDVLKLLQETYLNKVKMIYIDQPYNTGNDFIYKDDFAEDTESFLKRSNQKDEEGNRLVTNTDSNGRFHSDWLSMMYPRLKLARNLLKDEGVIFISIDDNEVHNLRKMCDEIFGEKNFVAQIIWKKRSTPPNDKKIGAQHEYILVYCKNVLMETINLRQRSTEQISRYKNPDNHPKGQWTPGDLMANVKGGRYVASLYFPIKNPRTGKEHFPSQNGNWRFNKTKIEDLIRKDEIYFGGNDEGRPKLKRFLSDVKTGITWTTLWDFVPLNIIGSKEMTNIFGNLTTFENPKPSGLIIEMIKMGLNDNEIILDFFSGSCSTAHAVMQLNAEDGGNRKFIMVQLPEPCNEKSEAFKAGYKTIAEIGKERIRRAGKKIKEQLTTGITEHTEKEENKINTEHTEYTEIKEKMATTKCAESTTKYGKGKEGLFNSSSVSSACSVVKELDIGFRVFKVDSSNMKDVYYTPDEVKQGQLPFFTENIKEDRRPEDLLFQVFLDWGIELTLPVVKETVEGKTVFFVDNNVLTACFDTGITEELVKHLAKRKPLRAVFRDSSYGSDSVKINVEQIFKLLSPGTEVRTI